MILPVGIHKENETKQQQKQKQKNPLPSECQRVSTRASQDRKRHYVNVLRMPTALEQPNQKAQRLVAKRQKRIRRKKRRERRNRTRSMGRLGPRPATDSAPRQPRPSAGKRTNEPGKQQRTSTAHHSTTQEAAGSSSGHARACPRESRRRV